MPTTLPRSSKTGADNTFRDRSSLTTFSIDSLGFYLNKEEIENYQILLTQKKTIFILTQVKTPVAIKANLTHSMPCK